MSEHWINTATDLDVVFNGPVGELGFVAKMTQVVDVAEELVVKLRVMDFRDRAELKRYDYHCVCTGEISPLDKVHVCCCEGAA